MTKPFELRAELLKVDDDLGLVLGWAIVCTENGEDYFDKQDDHITETCMLEAAADFAKSARVSYEQHTRKDAGTVLFLWPLTAEVAKAFEIECPKTGLMIGVLPDDDMLAKFKDGTLTGFSIGGWVVEGEDVD